MDLPKFLLRNVQIFIYIQYMPKIIYLKNFTSPAYKKQPTATVNSPKVALLHVLEAQLRNNKIEENPGPASP